MVKKTACDAGDPSLIPGSGRAPGEGSGNPLQYSCLDNSMDRGAWWTTVRGVTKESDMTEQLNNNKYIFLDIETVFHRVKKKKKLIPKTQPIGITETCD